MLNIKKFYVHCLQMFPYTKQWYELEQLEARVRRMDWAAGVSQTHQLTLPGEVVVSGLSSGSLSSLETLDEANMQENVPQGQTAIVGMLFTCLSVCCQFNTVVNISLTQLTSRVKPWVIQSFLTFDSVDRTLKYC